MGPKYLIILLIVSLVTVNSAQALSGTVNLISPDNETWTNKTNADLSFEFMFIDPGNVTADCTLNVNGIGYDMTNVANDTLESLQAGADFLEGSNTWNVTCENGTTITSENRVLFADRNIPSVFLSSPAGGAVVESGSINFHFNYTDALSAQATCTLSSNGSFTNSGSFQNVTDSILAVTVTDGYYTWWVNCTDNAGNIGSSGLRALNVSTPPEPISISVTDPGNTTYDHLTSIGLDFSVISGTLDTSWYSLDGGSNSTFSSPSSFDVPDEGQHVLVVYANDSSGNLDREAVHFTVDLVTEGAIEFVSMDDVYDTSSVIVNVSTNESAAWCLLSLDGDSNVSMTEDSGMQWHYNLTSLSEDEHEVVVHCDFLDSSGSESYDFRVVLSDFIVDIETPKNTTYWGTDEITILSNTNKDAGSCMFYLDSSPSPVPMGKYDERLWHYNLTTTKGAHRLVVRCNDSLGMYATDTVSFTLKTQECDSDDVGLCTDSQKCEDSSCVDLTCGSCEYADNHVCMSYECCADDDCLDSEKCVSNECSKVDCVCGEIVDRECIEYECCSNFDCGLYEECDVSNHECLKKSLVLFVPETIIAGQAFEIKLYDGDGNPVADAKIKVEYKSDVSESLTTDENGKVSLVAKESGPIVVTADIPGYEQETVMAEVTPGIDMTAMIILIVLIVAGGVGLLYWRSMPALTLKKEVKGQEVTLKVKNRSGEYVDSVVISDTVPKGAFISCGLNPRIEDYGNDTQLTWFAALNEDEEIVINYQSAKTSEDFIVRVGDDEYQSGYGIMSILQSIMGIFRKREAEPEY